jgi:aminocarboxymuconate-semialdehyde decarboxylase
MFVDFHAHFLPKKSLKQLLHLVPSAAVKRDSSGHRFFSLMGVSGDLPESIVDVGVRIKRMKKVGIDHEVLQSALSPMGDIPKKALRIELARTYNDEISSIAAKNPDHFSAFATLPRAGIDETLEELDRCVSTLGIKGVAVNSNFVERSLDDPRFLALYAKLEAKRVTIFLHPSALEGGEGPLAALLNSTVNLTAGTTKAVMQLATSGILERYPSLQVVAAHVGGTFPFLAGRIDRARSGFVPEAFSNMRKPPSESMKKVYVDTASASRQALICAHEFLGAGRLVLGTDAPYDNRWGDPSQVTGIIDRLDIPEEEKQGIFGGNAFELLGL